MANLDEISDNFYQYSYKKYLSEMQNSDKPDEHHFPSKSAFYEDFSTKVNATYNDISRNYPPEVAKYIYQSILFNLDKQSQNPAQSHIIDFSTGSINYTKLQANSKKVTEALKAKYPDKFIEINQDKTVNSNVSQTSTMQKIQLALNDPEAKEKFINALSNNIQYKNSKFATYDNAKTREEKIKALQEIYGWSQEEAENNLPQAELGREIDRIMKRLSQNNSDKAPDELEEIAIQEYATTNKTNIENVKQQRTEYNNHWSQKIKNDIDNISQGNFSKEDEKILDEVLDEVLFQNINVSEQTQDDNLFGDFDEELKEDSILDDILSGNIPEESLGKISTEETDSLDLDDLFGDMDIGEEDTSLDDILNGDIQKEEDLSSEIIQDETKIPNPDENTYKNPILSGVQISPEELETPLEYETEIPENPISKLLKNIRNRFTQARLGTGQTQNQFTALREESSVSETDLKSEDYTQNIEEKQSFFARMKNVALKFIGRDKTPVTPAINTAENNTPTNITPNSAFDEAVSVSADVISNTNAIGKQMQENKPNKNPKNSVIETDKNTLSM